MLLLRSGNGPLRSIVPLMPVRSIVSSPTPGAHSPIAPPEAVSVLAEMIASRRVHWSSSATTSCVLLTVMIVARAVRGVFRLRASVISNTRLTSRTKVGILSSFMIGLPSTGEPETKASGA
jgi:hypothetical protein